MQMYIMARLLTNTCDFFQCSIFYDATCCGKGLAGAVAAHDALSCRIYIRRYLCITENSICCCCSPFIILKSDGVCVHRLHISILTPLCGKEILNHEALILNYSYQRLLGVNYRMLALHLNPMPSNDFSFHFTCCRSEASAIRLF